MDKIWVETLKRLDDLEKRCERIENRTMISHPRQDPKPESEKDTVDLPSPNEPKPSAIKSFTLPKKE